MQHWQLISKDITGSTNDDAKDVAIMPGTLIWAHEQTGGRGRHDRHWHSPRGNLYCSFVIAKDMRKINSMSFIASLAVIETLEQLGVASEINCKWPNDVLVGGKKMSGILLEGSDDKLIIGIGLNVEISPESAFYATTSLTAEGIVVEVDKVLEMLAENLYKLMKFLDIDGFAPIRAKWLDYAYKLGGKICVRAIDKELDGIFNGITPEGFLILEKEADKRHEIIMAGDVFYL